MIRLYRNSSFKKTPTSYARLSPFSSINILSTTEEPRRGDERVVVTGGFPTGCSTDHGLGTNLGARWAYGLSHKNRTISTSRNRIGGLRAFRTSPSTTTTSSSSSSTNQPTTDSSIHSDSFQVSSLEDTLSNIQSLVPSSSTSSLDTATTPDAAAVVESLDSFERIGWPSDYMIDTILFIAKNTDLGLAGSVISFTVAFRLLVFPLFLKTQRNSSRMAHMKPEMDLLKQRLEKDTNRDIENTKRYEKQAKALFTKYDCHPLMSLALPLAQMPVFMSMFFALQRLPELYPQTLSMEGILWFPNLAIPDPYYILPLLTAGSFALTIEISKDTMKAADPALARTMVVGMRVLAALMVPFTATFPTVMFVYWLPNNIISLLSSLLLQQPSIRKKVGIWDPPSWPLFLLYFSLLGN
jgi:YidC/Oxa1 family membrane protein insertase